MSTSIALVTCAEVSSERRMCSAIPRRIAVMGSNCSPASAATGCGGGGAGGGGGGAGGGRGGRLGRLGGGGRRGCRSPGGSRRGCRSRRSCRGSALLDEVENVLLGHPAAAARALHLARVHAVLGGNAGNDGRDEALAVGAAVADRCCRRLLGFGRPRLLDHLSSRCLAFSA